MPKDVDKMIESKRRVGLIHLYTGDGKGKTTAALGLALRASGHGMKVCMIMFLKGRYRYGERSAVKRLPNLEINAFGRRHLIRGKPTRRDVEEAQKAFENARKVVKDPSYDLVILDEITHAINLGLVKLDDVVRLIREKPKKLEVVMTGRDAPIELAQVSDYVTEILERRHPYRRGITAREGIEY